MGQVGGGVGIYISRNIRFQRIVNPLNENNLEIIGIRVYNRNNRPIDLYSVYIPPSSNRLALSKIISPKYINSIFFGDFNAHHKS